MFARIAIYSACAGVTRTTRLGGATQGKTLVKSLLKKKKQLLLLIGGDYSVSVLTHWVRGTVNCRNKGCTNLQTTGPQVTW